MTYVASIDGFGDRDDIALARDKANGQITDNARKHETETHEALLKASEWGDLNQQSIVDLIVEMLRRGSMSMLGNKKDIYWGEIETISEALTGACIIEGLDDEYYSPSIRCEGFEYEVRLI
jgi:hypothetical protein